MKNNKTPGPDGFSVEFYKVFFKQIGHYVKSRFSITQYQRVIACIPKKNKPKQFIKNWRPISLLNVSYRILSGSIAARLQKVLPSIIHQPCTTEILGQGHLAPKYFDLGARNFGLSGFTPKRGGFQSFYKAKRQEGRLICASRLTMKDIFQWCCFFVFSVFFFIHGSYSKTRLRHRDATIKRPSRRLALFNFSR